MLFIHDHTFVKKNEHLYTTGSLNQKVMDRYKNWFGMVSVFATTRKATEEDAAFIRKENIVQNVDFHLVEKKNSIIHILKCCPKIKEEVKKADCVVIRMSILGMIGVHYAKKYKKPYLVEMVACPWDSLWYHSFKGKALAPIMTFITKRICKRAPYVLYVTNAFLQKRYPTNGISIGCSDVELENVSTEVLKDRNRIINELYVKHRPIRLCTLANIAVKYKGQDIIIKAIARLKSLGINCEYYLIGGGNPDRLKYIINKYKVEKEVHIIGPIPHEEVFSVLDSIDIYVQPSKQEGLPRAVIEAMSRACPVAGARTGGIPELIDADMVFDKGSGEGFIHVLNSLTKEKMMRYAEENYSRSKNYNKMYLDNLRNTFYLDFSNSFKGNKLNENSDSINVNI